MLTLGPDGQLIEIPIFQAAVVDFLKSIGAGAFSIQGAPGVGPNTPSYVAITTLPNAWEVAAGRSADEACVRLVERVASKMVCGECQRPATLDTEMMAPFDSSHRDYIDGLLERGLSVCTLYFDWRDARFKKSCHGFDPNIEPTDEVKKVMGS